MKQTILITLVGMFMTLNSCKEDKKTNNTTTVPTTNKRDVKYEVSGNFSGQLNFIYSNQTFGFETVKITKFPQTYNITYPNNVPACTAGGSSTGLPSGVSGETLTLKIYLGGTLSKTIQATANASGTIEFPNWGSLLF